MKKIIYNTLILTSIAIVIHILLKIWFKYTNNGSEDVFISSALSTVLFCATQIMINIVKKCKKTVFERILVVISLVLSTLMIVTMFLATIGVIAFGIIKPVGIIYCIVVLPLSIYARYIK